MFISMAKKGLYIYDTDKGRYKLIAKPGLGLKVVDLLKAIQAVLGELLEIGRASCRERVS